MNKESELIYNRYRIILEQQAQQVQQPTQQAQQPVQQVQQPVQQVQQPVQQVQQPVQQAQQPAQQAQQPAQQEKQLATTWGELKAIFKLVNNQQTKQAALQVGAKGAKIISSFIPGGAAFIELIDGARDAHSIFKTLTLQPDRKQKTPILKQLDIDDGILQMVDNNVEIQFFNYLMQEIQKHSDNEPLPPDWNMTNQFITYLRALYKASPGVQQHVVPLGTTQQSQLAQANTKSAQATGISSVSTSQAI